MVFSLWGGRSGWGMGRQGKENYFIKHLPASSTYLISFKSLTILRGKYFHTIVYVWKIGLQEVNFPNFILFLIKLKFKLRYVCLKVCAHSFHWIPYLRRISLRRIIQLPLDTRSTFIAIFLDTLITFLIFVILVWWCGVFFSSYPFSTPTLSS